MAKRVVDVLEMVKVEVMHCELTATTLGACEFQIEPFEKGRAVGKAGQRVGPRQGGDLFGLALTLGDVGQNTFDRCELAGGVTQCVTFAIEPDRGAVRPFQTKVDSNVVSFSVN